MVDGCHLVAAQQNFKYFSISCTTIYCKIDEVQVPILNNNNSNNNNNDNNNNNNDNDLLKHLISFCI